MAEIVGVTGETKLNYEKMLQYMVLSDAIAHYALEDLEEKACAMWMTLSEAEQEYLMHLNENVLQDAGVEEKPSVN